MITKKDETKKIWKYVLGIDGFDVLQMPPESRVLSAQYQTQESRICLWVLVNSNDDRRVSYPVWSYCTGEDATEGSLKGRYVSSVQQPGSALVVHLFVGLGA